MPPSSKAPYWSPLRVHCANDLRWSFVEGASGHTFQSLSAFIDCNQQSPNGRFREADLGAYVSACTAAQRPPPTPCPSSSSARRRREEEEYSNIPCIGVARSPQPIDSDAIERCCLLRPPKCCVLRIGGDRRKRSTWNQVFDVFEVDDVYDVGTG